MDPATGGFIIALLTLVARELRWHRVHGKVKQERDALHRSLHPPKGDPPPKPSMPPWDAI